MKRAKKNNQASKNRLLFLGSISLISIFVFLTSLFNNVMSIRSLEGKQASLEKNLSDLQEEEEYLKNEITKLKDPEYLARYARKEYQYTKDGEYVLNLEKKENEEVVDTPIQEKDHLLWGILATLGILYIVKKVLF